MADGIRRHDPPQAGEFFSLPDSPMKVPANDAPLVLSKWYAYAK